MFKLVKKKTEIELLWVIESLGKLILWIKTLKNLLIDSDGHLDDINVHVHEERIFFELKLSF